MRAIDETGANLGVIETSEALRLAKEKGLDLVEISPMAIPPVVKIISFDKYRYQEEKKWKKQRATQKIQEMKQVQISARAAQNDLQIKVHQLEKFLNEGHPVEISMRLRGREKYNKDWARQKLDGFLKMIGLEYKILSEPKFAGRGMLAQVTKK